MVLHDLVRRLCIQFHEQCAQAGSIHMSGCAAVVGVKTDTGHVIAATRAVWRA